MLVIKMNKATIAILVLSALILSACFGPSNQQNVQKNVPINTTNDTGPKTIEIAMTAKQFEFNPSVINAKVGDTIVLKVTSLDVEHGISIPEFRVTQVLPVNEEKTITFKVDKRGEFTFRCSVFCGSGHQSMTGKIVVE
ncbi:MAG TPA: cupredoxin domain-containing protein [Candidatus Nanoarchaeia archaeon]|nr:cupredoxin domain-containing protein [Candidatus Nanoarchaeia archaeon]